LHTDLESKLARSTIDEHEISGPLNPPIVLRLTPDTLI